MKGPNGGPETRFAAFQYGAEVAKDLTTGHRVANAALNPNSNPGELPPTTEVLKILRAVQGVMEPDQPNSPIVKRNEQAIRDLEEKHSKGR